MLPYIAYMDPMGIKLIVSYDISLCHDKDHQFYTMTSFFLRQKHWCWMLFINTIKSYDPDAPWCWNIYIILHIFTYKTGQFLGLNVGVHIPAPLDHGSHLGEVAVLGSPRSTIIHWPGRPGLIVDHVDPEMFQMIVEKPSKNTRKIGVYPLVN